MKDFDRKFGKEFLKSLPTTPGVYRFFDDKGVLIYIGKAKNLRRRLGQYRNAKRLKRHRKMKKILKEAARLEYESHPTDLQACLEELKLIQSHRPRWNVAGAFAFLYPMIGVKEEPNRVLFCFTTVPDKFTGYRFHGAYRSRHISGDAFFALMKLLKFIAHPVGGKEAAGLERAEYSYVFGFRRMPTGWPDMWSRFFRGESNEAMEELVLKMLENAGARAKAEEVQESINLLRRFWRHEVRVLAKAIEGTAWAQYPVAQIERDALFIRYRSRD
jgi:excinuclease ABC subunit C